ncbi:MAG: pyridoxamine 5'-phosphate oxidase family protein, partial [Candidatus Limnocylindrales bacterium]
MGFELTDGELAFIKEQRIGRLATASPTGAPDVAPALAIYRRSLGVFLFGGQGLE